MVRKSPYLYDLFTECPLVLSSELKGEQKHFHNFFLDFIMKTIIVLCLVILAVSAQEATNARQADPIGHLTPTVHKCIFKVVKDDPAVLKKVQDCLNTGSQALSCLKQIPELAECLKNA